MSSSSQTKEEYKLLTESKGAKSNFRVINNNNGQSSLEYSLSLEIPEGIEDNELNHLKLYMVKSLCHADFWINKNRCPKEYLNYHYNTIFWIWIDVAMKISVFYFYGYLRFKKKWSFLKTLCTTFVYMFGSNFTTNFIYKVINYNLKYSLEQYFLETKEVSKVMDYNKFEEKYYQLLSDNQEVISPNKL